MEGGHGRQGGVLPGEPRLGAHVLCDRGEPRLGVHVLCDQTRCWLRTWPRPRGSGRRQRVRGPPGSGSPRCLPALSIPQELEPSPVGPSVGGGWGRDGPVARWAESLFATSRGPHLFREDGAGGDTFPSGCEYTLLSARVTLPVGVRGHTELGPLSVVISAQSDVGAVHRLRFVTVILPLPFQHKCFKTAPPVPPRWLRPGTRLPPAGRGQSSFPAPILRPCSSVRATLPAVPSPDGRRARTAGRKPDGPRQ